MSFRKLVGIGLIAGLLLGGTWLLSRSTVVGPESAQRSEMVRQMAAPAGVAGSPGTALSTSAVTAVEGPVRVNLDEIPEGVYTPYSVEEMWLNGLIDLDENESRISQAMMVQLQAEAMGMAPETIAAPAGASGIISGGVAFDSLDASECCGGAFTTVPPDPEMAVGRDYIIATVNVAFEIYDKQGNSIVGPITFDSFFDSLSTCNGTFDPNAVYDDATGRYILGIASRGTEPVTSSSNSAYYCIAVSSSPENVGSWNIYSIHTSPLSLGNPPPFFDYPHVGVGIDAIFMGANMFGGNAGFEGRVWALDKAAMYAGQALNPVTASLGGYGGTPQPLNMQGTDQGTFPTTGPHYIFTDPYDGDSVTVWTWANALTGGTPSISAEFNLQTATGVTSGMPVDVPQAGSANQLEANDFRMRSAEYRNGHAWVSDSISCNPGGGTVNCVRWAQIELGPTQSLVQAGVIASSGQYRTFPDLSVNRCNDMLIGYTRTNSATFASVYVTGRGAADPLGTVRAETLLKAGEAAYSSFDGSPFRWGDYTSMRIDPNGSTFWYFGEYAKSGVSASANWGTYIGNFTFEACLTFTPTDFIHLPVANRN